jgi:hypothetical protein
MANGATGRVRAMRDYGPGRPLVFSHIPKTAGTSLRAALRQSLQPSVFVEGVDGCLFGGYDDIHDISPAARATVFLSPEEIPGDATLVAGHIGPWTTMERFPGADHITVLRSPQVRILSQWLHSRAVSEFDIRHWGSAAEAFRVGWLPLREYLEHPMIAPNTDNTITRFLAWPHPLLHKTEFLDEAADEELLGAALARLDAFGHVNVAENPGFLSDLGAWLGRKLSDTRLNERRSVPKRMRPDLATEVAGSTRELLDHRCRIDVRVWEHVARRVLPDADPTTTLEAAVQRSIEGYTAMLQEPDGVRPARRAVERLYDARVRLDPRRRSARR